MKCKDEKAVYDANRYAANPDYWVSYRANHVHAIGTYMALRHGEYREWTQTLRSTLVCIGCWGPAELFHHVDPGTKKFAIGKGCFRSAEVLIAELEKCVPMCSACHTSLHKSKVVATL